MYIKLGRYTTNEYTYQRGVYAEYNFKQVNQTCFHDSISHCEIQEDFVSKNSSVKRSFHNGRNYGMPTFFAQLFE